MDAVSLHQPHMARLLKQLNYDYNSAYTSKLKNEISNKMQKKEKIDVSDLMRIFLWKIDRIIDEELDSEFITSLNEFISQDIIGINELKTKEFIQQFNSLKGFHIPTISAILKFLRPDVFAIIDKRCFRVWKGVLPPYKYSVETYIEYLNFLHNTAPSLGLSIVELEEKMYELDKRLYGSLDQNQPTLRSIYPDINEKLFVTHELLAGDVCVVCKSTELVEADVPTFHDIMLRRCKINSVSTTIINAVDINWISICPSCDQYALGLDDNLEILIRDKFNTTYCTLVDYLESISRDND